MRGRVALAVALAGSLALLVRPWTIHELGQPLVPLLLMFVTLGAIGLLWPVASELTDRSRAPLSPIVALAIGGLAFALGRLVVGPTPLALQPTGLALPLLLHALAAVSEEAFFRRFLFGLLEPWGLRVAIWGSAVSFALVHVGVWGWWVLPLDLAAGLVLSWQRSATGRWTVPAITHVAANVWAFA